MLIVVPDMLAVHIVYFWPTQMTNKPAWFSALRLEFPISPCMVLNYTKQCLQLARNLEILFNGKYYHDPSVQDSLMK